MSPTCATILGAVFLLYTPHFGLSTLSYHGARLSSFTEPDFRTSFIFRSNNGSSSFRDISTGQNQKPYRVRVYAKVLSGVNAGFCFEGVGAAQVLARRRDSGHSYGGLIYGYNTSHVRIWAPSKFKTSENGRIIFVGHGWGGEEYSQVAQVAVVFVEVWNIGPPPTFKKSVFVDTRDDDEVFYEIEHHLSQLPERVVVRVSPTDEDPNSPSPNFGFWFNAISSSQNAEKKGYGGVIFAYNAKKIQLWAPNTKTKKTGCVLVQNGWGTGAYQEIAQRCFVEIFAWVLELPVPAYTSEWRSMSSQGGRLNSFLEVRHRLNVLPSLVIVQVQSTEDNKGLIFEGTGAVMSTDKNSRGYGGLVYAYDETRVRMWLPQARTNGTSNGFAIFVRDGWGNGDLRKNHSVRVRVILYTANCDSTQKIVTEMGICKTFAYNSYTWKTGSWQKCSSICNRGHNSRRIIGCEVSTSETVLSCGFDKHLCRWKSTSWKSDRFRLKQSSPVIFFATASSNSSQNPAVLASPKFSPRQSCSLSFKYRMSGNPAPVLSVEVATDSNPPQSPGWTMRDDQGKGFWRKGYVDLSRFNQLIQVFFKFALARKSDGDSNPPLGSVQLDDVKLECESTLKETNDPSLCREHKIPTAGCLHPATATTTRGPAFELFTAADRQTYVKAKGRYENALASYQFWVDVTGEYSLWINSFGSSQADNGVIFQIDNMDKYHWHTTYVEGGRPVWSQYLFETFTLKRGIHEVYLYLFENRFKFSHLALIPKKLLTWVPLGMQSRYIPDSFMRAAPPSSFPDPKYGRLNGEDAWCSSDHNAGYVRLEISLPELAIISRIAVQGGQHIGRRSNNYWVTVFALKVSVDGIHFSWYRSPSLGKKNFTGNTDGGGIVEHELPIAVLARKIQIFPYEWKNWICMRVELYGLYKSNSLCAVSGLEPSTNKECEGDRNCSTNAECQPITKSSIIKTGLPEKLPRKEACHCHPGYHGDSCQHVGCQLNPCHNGGTCHPRVNDFTCSCPEGYQGRLCRHPCPVGWYGFNCAHKCPCSNHGNCSVVTGHCSCQPGYFGVTCDQMCPRGYFGNDCKQRCRCRNNAVCDHVNGICKCTTGWTGPFCDQPCGKSLYGVHCRHSCKCSANAASCDPISGKCICKPGATGKMCGQVCPSGRYGLDCTQICKCSAYGVCNRVDGSCTCHSPGWIGIRCDQPCPKGFYGNGCSKKCDCSENGECIPSSGRCKCHSGYAGPRCNQPCSKNKWGPGCKNTCQCNHNATCDSITGVCRCPRGWQGLSCNSSCKEGTWGIQCQNKCDCRKNASCGLLSGVCQCQPGWTGTKCEKPCPNGFYGLRCGTKCPCVHGNTCEPITGACHCPPGWLGRTCAEACPVGYYGNRCSSPCACKDSSSCDHVNGACTCAAGWRGQGCNQRCRAGFFGTGCSQKCRCRQDNYIDCNHVTGSCNCKPGYTGARCDRTCDSDYYGVDCKQKCLCQNSGECRPADGKCICLAGYHGDRCEHECPPMHYGVNCSRKCSSCTRNQVSACDAVTGKCLCSPGYYGYRCENHCPEGRYGHECELKCDCKNGAHCNHVNGSCECAAGFDGAKCDQPCPQGRFGDKCQEVCLCENGGACDPISGDCSCLAGYNGTQCRDQCPGRRWGIECRNKCSCTWNHTQRCRGDTGVCECRAGYKGLECEEFCNDGTYGKDCQHNCPVCSRHVTGTCYKIDGRCPCSPGYRGALCDNDCPLKSYGKNCQKRCTCADKEVCYHVNGSCFDVTWGKFEIMIKENYSDVDDTLRQKQLKLHIASLISTNHGKYLRTLERLSRREVSSQTSGLGQNGTVTTLAPPSYMPTWEKSSPSSEHDFVARILHLDKGLTSDGKSEVVIITMVVFDKGEMLNGSAVKKVIESMDAEERNEMIGSMYYAGSLYQEKPTAPESVYVQLITGLAGGLLLLVILVILILMWKRRRRHLKKLKTQKQQEKEAETEMEMKTRGFRHNGYRLAFDNPYYDVLAAMALDDDIEEDYINPLCDLESLMSHQGSDGTVSSATECSIHKVESLQSVSYC